MRQPKATQRILQAPANGRRLPEFLQGLQKAYQRSRAYDKEYERRRNQTEKRKAYHAASLKRWRRENPHKLGVQLARRRARKLHAEGNFTVAEFEALREVRERVPPLR